MPNWLSEKVTKTLIEYITTSASTDAAGVEQHEQARAAHEQHAVLHREPVAERARSGGATTSRAAMFAITRGPSMKPACAATKSSSASEARVTTTYQWPSGSRAEMDSAREHVREDASSWSCPSTGCTPMSR